MTDYFRFHHHISFCEQLTFNRCSSLVVGVFLLYVCMCYCDTVYQLGKFYGIVI